MMAKGIQSPTPDTQLPTSKESRTRLGRWTLSFGYWIFLLIPPLLLPESTSAGEYKVYSTYLWHLQQPNYWPEKVSWENRYMHAYEHLSGSPTWPGHPQNNIAEIFGKDDRKAVYQYRARDTVSSILYTPDGGAQLSYSGCLIENISSLGNN